MDASGTTKDEADDDECPVCTMPLRAAIRTRPPCGHEVCLRCLLQLPRPSCVLCRADLAPLMPRPSKLVMMRRGPEVYVDSLLALVERADREFLAATGTSDAPDA